MKEQSLSDIYTSLGITNGTIYVVPLVDYDHSNSDYLYQLYKPLFANRNFEIKDVSIFEHFKFVVAAIFKKNIVLHYHWLEFQDLRSMMGMPWKLLCLFLFKLFGGSLVWTVHNLEPHDQKWLSAHLKMHQWMSKRSDIIHVHCSSSIESVSTKFEISKDKIRVHPHPLYPVKEVERDTSIDFINSNFNTTIDKNTPLLLLFGNISKYKGIEEVLDIIENERIDTQILIAGPIKKGQEELGRILKYRSNSMANVFLISQFIDDEVIPYFFGATDLCLFNYRKILTSGVVTMAMSYKKSIIAPNLGCISELGTYSNVQLFSSEKEKIDLLKRAVSKLGLNNE
jgi:glycosyltransferase involved in cell wall biosynthesis